MTYKAYHGCDLSIATAATIHGVRLGPSMGENEWLGKGVYFFIEGRQRAIDWAKMKESDGRIPHAAALEVTLDTGLCLNLADTDCQTEMRKAYDWLAAIYARASRPMPTNGKFRNGVSIDRKLDCAVIEAVHQLREIEGLPPYDSVLGAFEDGGPMFPGSAVTAKAHIQIAIRYLSYGKVTSPTICWQRP